MATCVNHPERQAIMTATPFPGVSHALCQECGAERFPICNHAEHAALEARAQAAEAQVEEYKTSNRVFAGLVSKFRIALQAAEADADRLAEKLRRAKDVMKVIRPGVHIGYTIPNQADLTDVINEAKDTLAQHAEAVRARGETA